MTRITLHEVGPRDGLQMERQVVPLEIKEAWIRGLARCGLDIIQVGSFVHPDKVPQMADTDELFRRLAAEPPGDVVLSGLVLNERGLERAMRAGVGMICMGASASETHSRKNTGMGTDEATARAVAMARSAEAAGARVQVSVQSAFGCGFEGAIDENRVLRMIAAYLEAGLRHVSLADTAGHASPRHVERLFGAVKALDPGVECACHFHDTYGLGMANIFAALGAGVRAVETSIAGLGGCPFTKVAAGNVATEDFVHAVQREGGRMDVHLDGLLDIARQVAAHFGRRMPGRLLETGPIAGRRS